MNDLLEQIVGAVLYEGSALNPYGAASHKNQRERFNVGRVYPEAFSENENGAEPSAMQAECLFQTAGACSNVKITFGFLQLLSPQIGVCEKVLQRPSRSGEIQFQEVPQLEVGGQVFHAWMESVERKVSLTVKSSTECAHLSFVFPINEHREAIHNEIGEIAGVILRRHEVLEGRMDVKITALQKDLFKICARTVNLSGIRPADMQNPEKILQRTFASAYFTLELEDGEFVSLFDPPPAWNRLAEDCKNIGCWPVLIGDENDCDPKTMLASPIILSDYPKIAPESTEEFLDGAEIDEMSALRVIPMCDEKLARVRTLKAAA